MGGERVKKGFTLIELVMVIVIIAILAAIAIPKFIDLRNNAKQAACDGNVATIRAALAAYYAKTAAETSAAFPTTLHLKTFSSNYFAAATLPTCPFSATGYDYNSGYNSSSGVVRTHSHL
jgi:MSHA pilin protein MshA